MAIITTLLIASTLGAAELVDDFERVEPGWEAKPTATLAIEGDPGERVLRADLDFTQAAYAWFRKTYTDTPLNVTDSDALSFRIKGGKRGTRLLVHLITDIATTPADTYVCSAFPSLDFAEWQTHQLHWSEFRGQEDGRRLEGDALTHIQAVNFSVTGKPGEVMTVLVDDVEFINLAPDVLTQKLRLSAGPWIDDEAQFFAALDYDAHPGLASVRGCLPDVPAAKAALLEYMRERSGPSYFFDPADTTALADAMREVSPTYPDSVIRAADRYLTHEYSWEGLTKALSRPIDYTAEGSQWYAVLTRFGFLRTVL